MPMCKLHMGFFDMIFIFYFLDVIFFFYTWFFFIINLGDYIFWLFATFLFQLDIIF